MKCLSAVNYVSERTQQRGRRYVGILTDGAEWHCYHLAESGLQDVAQITIAGKHPDADALMLWLDGVICATQGCSLS